jgi:hypothetical protein
MIPKDTEAPTAEIPFIDLDRTKFHLRQIGIANATGGIRASGLEREKLTVYRSRLQVEIMSRTEYSLETSAQLDRYRDERLRQDENESIAQLVEKVRLLEKERGDLHQLVCDLLQKNQILRMLLAEHNCESFVLTSKSSILTGLIPMPQIS